MTFVTWSSTTTDWPVGYTLSCSSCCTQKCHKLAMIVSQLLTTLVIVDMLWRKSRIWGKFIRRNQGSLYCTYPVLWRYKQMASKYSVTTLMIHSTFKENLTVTSEEHCSDADDDNNDYDDDCRQCHRRNKQFL